MHDPPKIPAKWRLEKEGVNLRVITGTCSSRAAECRSFLLGGPEAVTYASEGSPYQPSSEVSECVPGT
ncbi:hypothetical protein [Nonomuraea dietziae]|uniref:Uncharacterized protein n=1 Tax=Nonomuraea dietziae TaxID=65515 RepID=A0A7W5YUB4_9ACTN|nr:hypothetical protein [Nonomuraea dietziae]MBB3732819.1 hypothetical protein [Nonomuraea dietziae]